MYEGKRNIKLLKFKWNIILKNKYKNKILKIFLMPSSLRQQQQQQLLFAFQGKTHEIFNYF